MDVPVFSSSKKTNLSKIVFCQGCKFVGEGYPQILMIPQYHIYIEFFPLDKKMICTLQSDFPPFILISLPSSTCHCFHVPDVVGEWNCHHGNIYSDDAVLQESPQPCTSQSLHYTGYPRGRGQTFVLCVAGIRHWCHRIWKRVYTVSCINYISDLIPTKLSRGTDSS